MRPVAFTCSQLTLLIIHPRRGRMAFVLGNSKCHGLSRQPYRVLFSTWALPAQPCAQSENAGCMRRGCRIEWLSVCGHYRPNRTPGTKRGVGAHVRTARQSRDCLRVRPSRAPPLFVAVRSALGPVLPTVARARWRHFVASPLRLNRFFRRKLAHPLASVRSMV